VGDPRGSCNLTWQDTKGAREDSILLHSLGGAIVALAFSNSKGTACDAEADECMRSS